MKKQKKRWGDRRDGIWLRDEPALNQFMPYVYPNRADNEAYINEEIDLRPIEAYLAKKNEGRSEDKYTYFHIICAAVVKAFVLRPRMNRFISGNRLYQRKELSVAFVVKKKFSDHAEEGLAFRRFDADATVDKLHDSLCEEIRNQREAGGLDNTTHFMERLLRLPRFVLRLIMKILFRLDKMGKVPYALVREDPNYASVFLTNLGSIDLNCGYHHLSNWGTCSCFVVIGKRRLAPECHPDGSVTARPVLNIGVTLDERIADGYYYSKTMRLVQHLLAHPELLERPAGEKVDYLPADDRRFVPE